MSILRERVEERLRDLRISPITLAKSVGLERGFINDIAIGRKKAVREGKLELVAQALECDPAYLLGYQEEVRLLGVQPRPIQRASTPPRALVTGSGMPVLGVCQTDVWRGNHTVPDYPSTMPVSPDARFPHLKQCAYLIRPETDLAATVAVAMEAELYEREIHAIEDGAVVVIQRHKLDLIETSLRRFRMAPRRVLVPFEEDGAGSQPIVGSASAWPQDVKLRAVVTSIVKLLI